MKLCNIQPYIRLVNNYSASEERTEKPRIIYDHELIYITDGYMDMVYDGKMYRLNKYDLLFVEPNVYNNMIIYDDSNIKTHCIHFDFTEPAPGKDFSVEDAYYSRSTAPRHKKMLLELSRRNMPRPDDFDIPNYIPGQKILYDYFKKCYYAYIENTAYSSVILKENFFSIMRVLAGISVKNRAINTHPAVIKAADYINKNYMQKITIPDIADSLGFTPNYIGKIFKQYMKINIPDYIMSVRIQAAKKLLVCTSKPISDIAFEAGFCTQSYFSERFRLNEKITPTEYRHMMTGR